MPPTRAKLAGVIALILAVIAALGAVVWVSLPVLAAGSPPPRPRATPTTRLERPHHSTVTTHPDPALAPLPSEVVVVGDSLTVGAAPTLVQLGKALGVPVRIDAVVGRSTATGLERLAEVRPLPGAAVVMALGTNDGDRPEYATAVAAARELIPTAGSLVWATVVRPDPRPRTNAALRAVPAGTPPLRLLDWAAIIEAHPEYLAGDGVHCTAEGYRARAVAVLATATGRSSASLRALLPSIPAPIRTRSYDATDGRVPPEPGTRVSITGATGTTVPPSTTTTRPALGTSSTSSTSSTVPGVTTTTRPVPPSTSTTVASPTTTLPLP